MTNADRISDVYKGEIWSPRLQARARARIDWLVDQARGAVLDVGCSQGITTILCARRGLYVLGVDVEADRIEYAERDLAAESQQVRSLARFRVADGADLDPAEHRFDTVLLGEVVEHLRDPGALLAALCAVLQPDGVVALTTPFGYSPHHDHDHSFYPASLLEVLSPHVTVSAMEAVDGYLRVLARPGPMPPEVVSRVLAQAQPALEGHLLATEKALRAAESRVRRLRERAAWTPGRQDEADRQCIEDLRHRLATQTYKAQYAAWKLDAWRARRGWRVAGALSAVRRQPRSLPALPQALYRAVRAAPRPDPPKKVGGQGSMGPVAVPELSWPDGPVLRGDLVVATILDPFSVTAFRYEWRQIEPGPEDWRAVLRRERPALLFVESAWRGNGGAWNFAMTAPDAPKQPLRELVAWCQEQGIPTVFWNKEDPPNYERFIATARLFDHVFTVDGDRLPAYRRDLGHDRVGVLPFAAQPRVHNPVALRGGRVHDVAFAGTFFAEKHPARREQMAVVLEPARDFGLHIFSRMGADDPRYAFPAEYAPHVVGSLPYEQMLAAYRLYRVFLNVNSVTESPTMCARRVFELSACRTPVLSGYSRALEELFGQERIAVARTPEQTRDLLAALLRSAELRDRQAHLAQRLVLAEHTFAHRVDAVLRAVGLAVADRTPSVSVLLATNRPWQLAHAVAQVARQRHRPVQLVIALHGLDLDPAVVAADVKAAGVDDVVVRAADRGLTLGGCLNLALEAAGGDLIAKMDDDNLYGENYLSDLVTAFSYTDAGIVGKWAHYVHLRSSSATLLRFPDAEHSYTDLVQGGTILARAEVIRSLGFDDLPRAVDTTLLRRAGSDGVRVYAADRFNFVSMREADATRHTWQISDAALMSSAKIAFFGDPTQHVLF
jgi:spore maturation protein CgeB/SAM-dependent methyltransferase